MVVRRCVTALAILGILGSFSWLSSLASTPGTDQKQVTIGDPEEVLKANGVQNGSALAGACTGPKLVVHVGPQKTGTTAIQKFLIQNAGWLRDEFGLSLGFRGFAKATARFIVEPLLYTCNRGGGEQRDIVKEARLKDGLSYVYSQLNSSQLVVLSSEDFAFFDVKTWRCFMSLFGASTCMSAVVFHRDAASWYAAVWAEQSKVRSIPLKFPAHLASSLHSFHVDAHGDADEHLRLLNNLSMFQTVHAASYEFLKEAKCSGAAFLVCNASLGFRGSRWKQCKDSVNGRQKLWNESPPFAAIDVVRLARDFHEIKQAMGKNTSLCTAWNDEKFNRSVVAAHPDKLLTSVNPAIIQAAKNIPAKCARLDALFHSENEKWFSRTGAEKPTSVSRDICTADVAAFGPRHWQTIRKISPHC
ncbi:unnamed protein product [Symbiodinium sp. CCMP2592]|nr:unnamed protein product [Symbiodinium sp. CCMP2592]